MRQLRVVVVDDSQVFRTQLASAIDRSGCARVVGHAADGREALERVLELSPELVTLDVEMPVKNGLETLSELRRRGSQVKVVMVSAHTRAGAEHTVRALELGAHDFITKPNGPDRKSNTEELQASVKSLLLSLIEASAPGAPSIAKIPPATPMGARLRPEIVAIGSSTGGPSALARLVPLLPSSLPTPVVIAQHMPPLFTKALADALSQKSALRVVEAEDGMPLRWGTVYVAPGGRHMRVAANPSGGRQIELTDDPPENYCRPAVDYLFRSVADSFGGAVVAVILTGMGKDGTAGLRELKRRGARVIGQDQKTCTVYGMPREAKLAGVVDIELPPEQIANAIAAAMKGQA